MNNTETKVTLLKPLFVDGMFNKSGKRSRFIEVEKIGNYQLYKNINEYIYVNVNDYLIYLCTAENFENYASDDDEQFIKTLEIYFKKAKEIYLKAKDDPSVFPDFVGACILGELGQAVILSEAFKVKAAEREKQEQIEREKQKQAEQEQERKAFNERILKVTEQFKNLGKIDDIDAVIGLAENLNINIPLRTKGWMMNNLVSITLREEEEPNGDIGYRYRKETKNSRGSQAVFTVIRNIRNQVLSL